MEDIMKKNERLVWHDREIMDVIDLLLECKTRDDVKMIFDRILTPREINDIGRRYKTLIMLDEGRSYADIRTQTGMSPTTINRLATKCGFGFSKSSGLDRPKKIKTSQNSRRPLRYKGVKVI